MTDQKSVRGRAKSPAPLCASCHKAPGNILLVLPPSRPGDKMQGWYLCAQCLVKLVDSVRAGWEVEGPLCPDCPYKADCPDAGKLPSARPERVCPG